MTVARATLTVVVNVEGSKITAEAVLGLLCTGKQVEKLVIEIYLHITNYRS